MASASPSISVRPQRRDFVQQRQRAGVALDRDDLRAGTQQGAGQPAGTGADLEHRLAVQWSGYRRDPAQQLFVEQEILPQRFARHQSVPRHRLAHRRQRRQRGFRH